MNAGVFKLVFNKHLGMLVPIAEVLTPKHGGGTGRTRGTAHGIRPRLARLAGMVGLALLSLGLPGGVPFVIAQTLITPDGRTLTVVGNTGAIWNVNTSTVSGSNAFNSFSTFNVGAGSTVNLHVPSAATNLINIVRDQRTDVYGILNAIKDGRIGGNVWFANPHGFVVGAGGVVNVGSLTVTTPTQGFVDGFFTAPGSPDGTSVGQLLAGTAPRNSSGLISIQGRVNAIDGVKLDAGTVNVAGSAYSGARFTGTAPDFSDVVNANGLVSATNVVVREGRIEIVADGDVSVSGTLAAPGGSWVRGGDVAIRAGGNVDLQSGALIAARGNGDHSAGGTVNIRADRDAVARTGALVDASAGSSGDGGFIEFSAKNTVELAGGEFRADGTGGGKGGSVVIDPANIIVSADILRGAGGYSSLPAGAAASGANLTLLADNEITVNDNVSVSTRSVAGTTAADHTTGASTAASGNLTLEAGSISLKSGSKLLAGADSGFAGGDVTLKATRNWTGEARIGVDHATITGGNVALTASATYNDSILTSWLPVVVPVTVATIDIDAGTIAASGTLSLGATSIIKVSSSGLSPLGMITAVSASTVDVRGASVLTAGGNTTLASSSTVTSKATPGGPNPATLPGDAGVATNVVVSTARTHLGDTSSVTVSGGTLDLTARNAVTATTTADSTAGGAVAIGGTLALSEVTSVTQAVIDGSATTSSAALTVGAEASSVVTTSAKAASKGAKKQTAAEKTAAPSETEKNLAKYKDQTTTSDGTVDVAAAVAIANVNNITLADMASTGTQASTGAATVSSKASSSSTVTADGSSASGSVGVGAAVGVNIGVLVNQARVAGNANVSSSGLTVSALMPVTDAKNRFVTTATSGAGASSVGVAGALATNVLVNTNVATLEGGGAGLVNLNGGDLVVESKNTSESLATAGASVKPASATEPAAVGVGASVGVNVAVNTTLAEIGDSAVFNGAKDVGLTAKGTHTLTTAATGGAAGADISVTPVAAITVAANTTTARLGTGSLATLSGAFNGSAEQMSTTTSTATGQTQGNNVAVGASIALNSATDTVLAEIDRNVTATGDVGVNAKSVARSGASATASVSGGEKSTDTGAPPAKPDGSAGATVDEKVTAQGAAAKDAGKKTAEKAAAGSPTAAGLAAAAASSDPDTKKAAQTAADKSPAAAGPAVAAASNDSKTKVEQTKDAPKTEETTESGGVAVAAAVGVNVGIATTTASIGKGRTITSTNGALKVTGANETDTSAKADGSQVDPGNTSVGVGAAVALNAGISTNVAAVGDDAVVNTKGLTISAVNVTGQASDSKAEATSGAGAGDVGVAGSLAANVAINTTVAVLAGDAASGGNGTGAAANANDGDILIEAGSKTTGAVVSGAKVTGTGGTAKVGVGASIGVNVGVNTTVAEVGDKAVLAGGKDFGLNARADHALTTDVTGGAAGARVAVTPLVAATVAVNTTTAQLGEAKVGDAGIAITGKYSGTADHTASATTTATGQTQGNSVAIGASIGLTVATDTVTASLERDMDATTGVELSARSVARSGTSATASVAGGEKADADDKPPAKPDGTAGNTVDQKVAGQQTKATDAGKAAATKAPAAGAAATAGAGAGATAKLNETKAPPTTEEKDDNGQDKGGGVSVAAAVGVNAGIATTTASVAKGKKISSRNGALKVKSAAQLDAKAKADGSQVNGGNTDVGVGAAVALNLGVGTNVAVIGDNADVDTKGVTVQAVMAVTPAKGAVPEDKTSDFGADAKSGAGANNVGVAGALAVNTVVNTTVATIEGDKDGSLAGANVNATTAGGAGDVLVEAQSATKSTVASGADVKMEGDKATVGVGASVGLNVAVNTTVAEIADAAVLSGGNDLDLNAKADHVMSTTVTGGAAGAKVAITPVAAVSIAVNTTTARAGTSSTALSPGGELSVHADQTDKVTTKATGQAQGDVAVGASLAASVVVETVSASVERDVASSTAVDVGASSESSVRTAAVAGAKGAKAAKKDADGKETPEAGTTVDEQKKTQLDSAKKRNDATKSLDTDTKTPAAETPEVNKNDTTEVNKDQPPAKPPAANDKKQESKKVSVAAAIGVGVVVNQAKASIGGAGRSVTTTGKMGVKATTDTNYETTATGEAVSDNIGIAAAVALTGTFNKTQANIAAGTTVVQAGDIDVIATANQNCDPAFRFDMAAEAVSGASGGDVAVAGSLAVVGNYNETHASIEEGVTIGSGGAPVGDITVKADETSKLAARARAGALSTGKESKAGVGASFAAILSYNTTTAAAGYDTLWGGFYTPTWIYANSLTVAATKHKVDFVSPLDVIPKSISGVQTWVKNFDFDALDPLNYLGSNNYYTEAVAGAAAKGDAAVAGSFAVNLFMNTTEAYLGKNVHVTTSGSQAGTHPEALGVEVAAASDTRAIAFAGAVAGAKKAGVGISNTDIVNFDETNASIGGGSVVKAQAADSGVKVTANAAQVVANVAVSAGIGTESTGVGGVLGIDLSMNKAEATIGEAAQVQAEGNVSVGATNDSVLVMIAGGVGGGKEVGVGAAVGINALWNRTLASIARDAVVDAKKNIAVTADADEVAVTAVVSGAGGGKAGVAASLAFNVILADTEASVGQGVKLNTSAGFDNAEKVAISARDDTVVVGVSGGGAGGGDAGVGAALDTDVVVKTVKAFIADDTVADGQVATIKADKEVSIDAAATETIVSIGAGFAGGGKAGVGGSVAIAVVANDVQAYAGKSASIDSDGNVLIRAQDDTTAVLTAIAGAGGGTAGVGGSLAVATVVGGTKAYVGESAHVNARGLGDASSVYTGETGKITEAARGLAVMAYNTENVVTTDVSGAGGGNAGVAVSLSGNVIANTAEAYIGRSAKINESNAAAGAEQQVLVKAVNETVLVNNAGGAGFGGTAGVGAAVNLAVIAKNTRAFIGSGALVNARRAVELDATSSEVAVGGTLGFAIGGSAGVGASLGGVGLGNTTEAYIEDAADSSAAAKVNVSEGDLRVDASDLATTTLLTGGGGGGGSAGVGGAIAVNVNASTTLAKIGDYAETNASGTTAVHADSVENTNTVTVAGAGGGSAGVGGAASIKVVVSKTEAGIGENAKVNQDASYKAAGQDVDVKATDKIITVGVGGVGAGGGAAGVGGSADITVVLNTTTAYIGDNARVDAVRDVSVAASGEKYVNSATFAGAGGGSAGVAGGISIISVGSLLDGEAKSGLSPKDENGNPTTTQKQADDLTTKSSVAYKDESGNTKSLLGDSAQSQETTAVLDSNAGKMAISSHVGRTAPIDFKNTQAFIGNGAEVKAGGKVTVSATDTTLAILAAGAGAGGGAAGVAGTLGVILLHDSAEAFIADNAKVDAGDTVAVNATTGENVFNVAVTGAGAGAAAVNGSIVVNVVSSDTAAYIGAAEINKNVAMDAAYTAQSVDVGAHSSSNLVAVAGAGNGAGAAAVGGVLNVNTLVKRTKAYIGRDADVAADENVKVSAESAQNVVAVGASFGGAGAAAVSGAADVNVVANVTEAFIGAARDDADKSTGARVDSDGNVSLAATDDSLVISASAVGNGAGAAAVGVNAGVNVISSQTRAYVAENSAVNARGTTAGTQVYSGTIADATAAQTPPAVPGGGSGDIDIDRDGVADGSVANGVTLNTKASSSTQSTVNPGAARDADGNPIAGAAGGLGSKGTETVKGLSVLAMGNEKVISATIGVAGAGAAAVTGAATANVISSVTEASIGDGAQINMSGAAGVDPSVRVRAADNTLMVQAGGTVTGAGAAAVSGTFNAGIVAKTTSARIGDADVNANDVEVRADSSEKVFTLTANASIAGAAGVGAGIGVDVISNETSAGIGAGAHIDATGDITVDASQNTLLNINTAAVAGGIAGVGGGFSVGVIDNRTTAYVEGSDDLGDRTTLHAGGKTTVSAASEENLVTTTISGSGGVAGVTGAFGVKVLKSDTDAYIGRNSIVTAQDVDVSATDTTRIVGAGGAVTGGLVGVGGTLDATIVVNTTSAHIDSGASVTAVNDVTVEALSDKFVNSTTIAGSGGAVGVAGAVSIVSVGALLDGEAKSGLNGDDTGSLVDSRMKNDTVSGQLGSSEHVAGTKADVSGRIASQGVQNDLKGTVAPPLRNTMAFIGSGAQVKAGNNLSVAATDQTLAVITAGAGAGGAFAGVAGTLGVVLLHDAAEAYIADGAQADAGNALSVAAATQDNVSNIGITGSGAAGVAASGSIAVNAVSSETDAYIGNADINRHSVRNANQSVAVTAASSSNIVTVAGSGGVAGAASIGGVLNINALTKHTSAYIGSGADVAAGKEVEVRARSTENIVGAGVSIRGAGLGAASAVISANVADNTTEAYIDGAVVDADGNVKLSAVDDTLLVAVSAVGNGAGGTGVGQNVGANVVTNHTRAYVSGAAEIDARGSAAASDIYTGSLAAPTAGQKPPAVPGGGSGAVDIDRNGVAESDVQEGASFSIAGKEIDPGQARGADGNLIGAAQGGLGSKATESVKGLSVVAMNNEKMITATVGIAGAGGTAVTGASTADVIASVTEAMIGDGAKINTGGATANSAVRVRAADNTVLVQTGATFAAAGAAGLSGSIDSGIVTKETYARIGDADVNASSVEVSADSSEAVYNITVNAALAGGAGVGGAVGVDVIRNKTWASIGAGADIDASGNISVNATQDSATEIYTVSGAGGIGIGFSGAVSVGVIANETKAYVEGSAGNAATLNAGGTTSVVADSSEKLTSATISGAAGGLAGVAGAVGVKVVGSTTEAYIGNNTQVNQTRGGAAQDVVVSATDHVTLRGAGGTVALAGYAGVGATAEINIVRNTTAAYIGDSALVDADRDLSVSAASTKDVQSAALAAAGGLSVGIGGALSVVSIGARLDDESQKGLRDPGGGGNTASSVDGQISNDKVSGQLGSSTHLQGMKAEVAGGVGGSAVAADMNESSAASLDKTRAYIGSNSQVVAGGDVSVFATDKVKADIKVAGAAGGFVGIGGALGVGVVHSTTEAFVGTSAQVKAGDQLKVEAKSENLDGNGSKVTAVAGAGGIIGLSAALAVMNNTSSTQAYSGSGSTLIGDTTVSAVTNTKQSASATGIAVGVVAVGASIAHAGSDTDTRATLGANVNVSGSGLDVEAGGTDDNFAAATAGSGGLIAGAAASATTGSTSNTLASVGAGDGTHLASVGSFRVNASHTTRFNAEVDSLNASLAGASGAFASHAIDSTVLAEAGDDARILANSVSIGAENRVEKDWLRGASGDAAAWNIRAGSGGVIGAPAGKSESSIEQVTTARVGDDAKIHVLAPASGDGVFTLDARNVSIARDKAKLDSGGAIAIAKANSMVSVDRADATVSFGINSEVISDVGSIDAGSRNDATLETRAAADTYGLAGAPDGSAHTVYRGATNTVVGAGALLRADDGAVNLAAGRDSSGNAGGIDARATVNLWNKTAIPIPTLPDALTSVLNNADLTVSSGANFKAATDITLTADRSGVFANAIGIGKDIYREAAAAIASGISNLFGGDDVSFDVRGGSASAGGFAGVRVDGNVETGIYKDASLTLDVENYNAATRAWELKVTRSRGVAEPAIDFQVGIAADINKRRTLLVKLAKEYAGTAAGDAYQAEVNFLEHKLVELGLAHVDGTGAIILGTGGGTGISPRAAALTRVASLTAQKNDIVLNQLPPVVSQLDAAATALDNYNTVFLNRSNAISQWATEAAASSPDPAYIAARKAEVTAAETTLNNRGVTGWVAQGAAATPNLGTANNERSTYNTNVVQPLQVPVPALTTQKAALETQRDDLTDNLFVLNRQITGYTDTVPNPDVVYAPLSNVPPVGPAANFVTVPNIKAQLGSIRVTGDALTGGGKLKAPGDARVTITNNTPDYLIVQDITVDADAARVSFNGVDVASNTDISRLNGPGHAAAFSEIITGASNPSQPAVTITSTYDPNSSPYPIGAAPDIRLTGNISNPRGLVQVHSAAGSILSQGNIYAGTVDIKAANGDFVQSYVDNFFHIGGDPKAIYEGTTTPGGVIANGNVFISSRYININGIIQSGIASYTLTLPTGGVTLTGSASMLGLTLAGNNQAAMDAYRVAHPTGVTTFTNDRGQPVTYNAAKNRLEVSEAFAIADAASAQGKTRNPTGEYALVSDYGNVGARYDTANDRYLINGTEVKGGYIQLFGQIINTAKPDAGGNNAGKLLVLDGYGQINIANPSGKDIVIARLDAGQGTAGVIDITDIQYIDASKAAHSIRSVFTRENGNVKITQKGRWTLDGSGLPVSFNDNWTDTSTTKSVVGATGISGGTSTRTATYNPQPGLAFTYTTGQDQSTYEDFSYEGTQFIGISSWRTWPNLTDYRIAGPYKSGTPVELTNGRYLSAGRSLANTYNTSSSTTITNGPAEWKTNNEYTYCDWWSLCITQTYHIDFSRITPTKDIVSTFLRADNPIAIQFIGGDYGTVSVKSAQNAILTGTISNKTGTTTIVAGNSGTGVTAANKSIVQGNDDALIVSKDLVLGASGSIGASLNSDPARLIRTAISGSLTADAANGNVLLRQTLGDLKVDHVVAGGSSPLGTSRVNLQAEGSILAAVAGSSRIEADRVDLTSDTGSIGSIATPLLVNVGYNDDTALKPFYGLDAAYSAGTALRPYYGLKAAAQGDIGIATAKWAGNVDGNLLVDTVVSTAGDIKLVAPGRIIDNNPIEQVDARTWSELLSFWNSLALREGSAENLAKQQQAVKAFEFGKSANYRLYWQMRERQADPASYNAGFVYSVTPAERQALTDSGMSGAQISAFEGNRTAQYHQLNTEVGGLNGGAFSAGYSYVATTAESDAILHKSSWTDRELAISVSPGLLKNITNTNPVIKSANVQGKTVTLQAGVAIGETTGDMTIPTSTAPSALTDEQKIALAVAERADIGITDSLITVRQRKPFNFDAATALNVDVGPTVSAHADYGNAFLASLGDGLLGNFSVPGDTRVKVLGSILNAPTSLVQTGNLILEAANGGVGYLPSDGISPAVSQPMRLSLLPGVTLTARGAGDVDVVETGDLDVDTVFSRGQARLTAAGSILDAYDSSELNVLAGSVTLTPGTGSVGTAGNPLDAGVTDPLGRIVATSPVGQGIYLNGPLGAQFNIGSILSGDAVWLSSDLGALIDGTVSGPGMITLSSGGTITMTPKADVHATTFGVFVRAGGLVMEDAQRLLDTGEALDPKYVAGDAAQIRVDVGTIDIQTSGDALITGIRTGNTTESAVRIVSTAGRILDNGDTRLDIIADQGNARLTISGALGIGDDPLDVRLANLDATSGGVVDLAAEGPLNIVGISAGDRVLLSATGDITGDAVTSTGTGGTNPDQTVSITSNGGGVTLASVSGQTGVSIAGQTGVDVDVVNAGTSVQLAGPVIDALVNGGAGPVGGSVTGFGGGMANEANLTLSGAGGFSLGSFLANNATVDNPLGSLGIGNAIIGNRATFSNPQTLLLVDQHDKSLQPADIQIYTAGGTFSLYLSGNHLTTEAMVIHSSSSHEVSSASGPSVSAVQQGEDTLARLNLSPSAPEGGAQDEQRGSLVSFSGTPVSTECSGDDPGCAQ